MIELIAASLWLDLAVGAHARNTATSEKYEYTDQEAYPFKDPIVKAEIKLLFEEKKNSYGYISIEHISAFSRADNELHGFNAIWVGAGVKIK